MSLSKLVNIATVGVLAASVVKTAKDKWNEPSETIKGTKGENVVKTVNRNLNKATRPAEHIAKVAITGTASGVKNALDFAELAAEKFATSSGKQAPKFAAQAKQNVAKVEKTAKKGTTELAKKARAATRK